MNEQQREVEKFMVRELRGKHEWRHGEIAGFMRAMRIFGTLRPDCPPWLVSHSRTLMESGSGMHREELNRELLEVVKLLSLSPGEIPKPTRRQCGVGEGDMQENEEEQ
jgi:hypothetical protein